MGKGRIWPLHSATRQMHTHVSAIDKTSCAFSHQGRRAGGNMEPGINGVSLGHSASVNASASVPFSQLWCQSRQNWFRTWRGRPSGERSAYLCVDMLTALSRTRRRSVVFNPRYARGTGAEETRVGKRTIAALIAARQNINRAWAVRLCPLSM